MSEQLRNIHLRRIAWAISSPSLLAYPFCTNYFKDNEHEANVLAKLYELDSRTELVNAYFNHVGHMPMGKYFEQLICFMLMHDNRLEIVLKNHQVIEQNTTLGELDLIVRDRQSQQFEHWELALKFYLQCNSSAAQRMMIGPNAVDNLARKMKKLTKHQMRLSTHASIKKLVGTEPIESKLFLKGQFFYHANDAAVLPTNSHPNHEKGWWCRLSEMERMITEELRWCILEKPDWIGHQHISNDTELHTAQHLKVLVTENISQNAKPLLVVGMQRAETGWTERTRGFVVADGWPNSVSIN